MFRQGFVRSQKFVRPTQQLGSLRSLRALTTSPGTALSRAYSKNHVPNASIYKNPLFKGTHISTLRQCYGPLARSAIYQTSEKFSTSSLKARVKTRDTKREAEIRHEILKSDPQSVSATSTVVPIFGGPNPDAPPQDNEVDMLEGLKSDLRIVRDTFKLSDVPKDVLLVGMGGIIPYVVTSFSTIGLAWELNYAQTHGDGYLLSHQTALELMHVLEPVQVGYGAVIISFLGAIHWGLEFAGYGGRKSRRRYAIGLLAPALAWPTILMPLHLALPTQFFGFTAIYFFDAAATAAGLAPPWYSTYRFVLTSIVGASLILTLIGRGQAC
ncbi:hypothetical protein DFH27DRAFT_476109 [Peziza echinospora]|nr:hypothetical protein DFH27DRAFT_476109 [Peziza echinospora]